MSDNKPQLPTADPRPESSGDPLHADPNASTATSFVSFTGLSDQHIANEPTHTRQPDPLTPAEPTPVSQPDPAGAPRSGLGSSSVPQVRNLSRYRILGEHGRGGLGKVSRAHDLELGRDIAIKELLSRGAIHEIRFMREALITARLEHPGIVPVHEAGRWPDGTPFYAMKLVAGRPLRDILAESKALDARIALLHHVIAVTDAIAYAHGCNIIHRDLKPGNVIIGDFGETVVIDWGLAKDLSVNEQPSATASAPHAGRNADLTSAGAVLGTPAYMAPEQQRGEPVDQRADVYAIGAMLWELCSVEKLSNFHHSQRQRILRRSGIDPDLIAIINKALASDPDARYPDAGKLASDLKAFRAGARIAARRYSVGALLRHWARRHRGLTLTIFVAFIVTTLGGVIYVRNIATERDRADIALRKVEATQKSLVEANQTTRRAYDELSLKSAELLSKVDPSSAEEILQTYRGSNQEFAKLLKAKVQGLGVARIRTSTHKDSILLLEPLRSGKLLSVSEDGSVGITGIDGRVEILASDSASRSNLIAYSGSVEILAYVCQAQWLCLLDVERRETKKVPVVDIANVVSIALSAEGRQLVIVYDGRISLWKVDASSLVLRHRNDIALVGGRYALFVYDSNLVVTTNDGIRIVDLDARHALVSIPTSASVMAGREDHVVVGDRDGRVLWVRFVHRSYANRAISVCRSRVKALEVLPTVGMFAYGCQDGAAGIIALSALAQPAVSFHFDSPVSSIGVSEDQRYVAFGVGDVMHIFDVRTGSVTSVHGQNTRLIAVSGPSASFPYFSSGDDDGYVRIWDVPRTVSRVVIKADSVLFDAAIWDDGTVISVGSETVLRWHKDGLDGSVRAHDEGAFSIRQSPDGLHFLTFGLERMILWSRSPIARIREIRPSPAGASFMNDGISIVSGGSDGRLLLWEPNNPAPRTLAQFLHPLVIVEVLRAREQFVVAERDGTIWVLDPRSASSPKKLRAGHGELITYLAVSDDSNWVGAGTSEGEVLLYKSKTWEGSSLVRVSGAIHMFSFSPDVTMISIVSEDGAIYLLPCSEKSDSKKLRWRSLALSARIARFSPDGTMLAITTSKEGIYWYSLLTGDWRYFPLFASIPRARFSSDGNQYVAAVSSGKILLCGVKDVFEPVN